MRSTRIRWTRMRTEYCKWTREWLEPEEYILLVNLDFTSYFVCSIFCWQIFKRNYIKCFWITLYLTFIVYLLELWYSYTNLDSIHNAFSSCLLLIIVTGLLCRHWIVLTRQEATRHNGHTDQTGTQSHKGQREATDLVKETTDAWAGDQT